MRERPRERKRGRGGEDEEGDEDWMEWMVFVRVRLGQEVTFRGREEQKRHNCTGSEGNEE